jgi:hypothetical protein
MDRLAPGEAEKVGYMLGPATGYLLRLVDGEKPSDLPQDEVPGSIHLSFTTEIAKARVVGS